MTENTTQLKTPHALSAEDVCAALETSHDGLSSDEARARQEKYGLNRLPEPEKKSALLRFVAHFHDVLIYILIAAAVVTGVMQHWVDTGVILGVVVVNALIGFLQEGKAEKALESIKNMLSLHAHVLRDGTWHEEDAETLVPGDIVRLRSGDRVPADMRLWEAINLRIEESALTGESIAAEKDTHSVAENAGVGDRYCMAYAGTMVAAGRGYGVVTGTGAQTEIGRITTMIAGVEKLATPLTRQMTRFSVQLSYVIVGMAILMTLVSFLLYERAWDEVLFAAIGFAVAAIPEGLPAILTITLALGVQRMAQRNAITRKLNAVETLGSVTVICSDKTGTLTKNEMTTRHVVTRADTYDVSGTGYAPEGRISRNESDAYLDAHPDLHAFIEVMAVCNDAEIAEEDGTWTVLGEPTEGALRTLARKAAFDDTPYERIALIPFESANKFMATLNRVPDGALRILLKGAPDRVLDRSTHERGADGSIQPLDRAYWEEQMEELSAQGLRVLAAAIRDVETEKEAIEEQDIESHLVFVGLAGIIDPPRPEAIEAIKACHTAGIRVKMITGDHAGTAIAIGKEMGVGDGVHAVTGAEIEAASDEELQQIAQKNDIFARTSPEHKLRLVTALQAKGEVVAMTGDGVNDAPALTRADVGVAMGIKGTEATKEAADIVLTDDNFTSIERAVEEGRTIYDNLRKAILFILPTNGAEALVILAAVVFGFALPLTPVQILWVNMVTAVTLALAMAFEPAEPGVMARPPRATNASILGGAFLWRIGFVSVLIGGATIAVFLIEKALEMPLALAQTLAVNTLVCGQVFYLFNSRFLRASSMSLSRLFSNHVAWMAVGALALLQLLFVYAPFMHTLFSSAPLAWRHWLIPLGIGAGVFLCVEAEKAVVRKLFPLADSAKN